MKKRLGSVSAFVFMLCLLLFGFGFFWSLPCEAQWIKTYGGKESDNTYSIQQTQDGGYIVGGQTYPSGATQPDAWLLKLDAIGNVTWQKMYGGTEWDTVSIVQQTVDGGYIVVGETRSFGAGDYDAWILKLNGDGAVTWQKTYGGTADDYGSSIQQTVDGGYIVAAATRSFSAVELDVWILKLDGDGAVTWQKTYGGTGWDYPYSIQQTADGGYIVAGETLSFGAGNYDVWLLKLGASGDVLWQKTYGGTARDYPYSVQQTMDGGYIVAGETNSFGAGDYDAWILKLDGNGAVTWQKTYGGAGYDYVYAIRQTLDGGYIVSGGTDSLGAEWNDAWVMKIDENGSTGTCPFEGTSTAVISDTTVTALETSAITATTSVTGADTPIVPADSTATSSGICPLSDKQFLLKVGATRKRQGEGTIASLDGFIDCPDTCRAEYNPGVLVTLTATPSPLSTFLGWKPSSLNCLGTDPCQVTMDKKKSVKAVFQGPNKLKVVTTFKNNATGAVTSGDTFINCPVDCEELYILDAPVTLTANAGVGSTFVKWTGRPCKDILTNECTFTMDKNATVKAIFQTDPE